MTPCMTPFFDTRDGDRIRFALNLLNYPQHYCLKASNQPNLTHLLPPTPGVKRLVLTLRAAQQALAAHLPMSAASVWRQRETIRSGDSPATTSSRSNLPDEVTRHIHQAMNLGLVEGVVERVAKDVSGTATESGVALATACVWLSQHLALVALGIAKAEITAEGELAISPDTEETVRHLRRLWFATAFEEMSLTKAHANLEVYALLAGKSAHLKGDVEEAFSHAVAVIPQHWRLPADKGPVEQLMLRQLMPLVELLGRVYDAAMHQGGKPLFAQDLPVNAIMPPLFADVLEHQRELIAMDRLFNVECDGLALGNRKIAPGLLLISEHLAAKRLGPDWHAAVSEFQKHYIIERLSELSHVDVIDIEVRQHDNVEHRHVDVDFLVRDRHHDIVFAVQLKHFQFSNRSGLRSWLERFRSGSLAYGIAQLQAIKGLALTDAGTRALLLAHAITEDELQRLVPVVLHNVGVLDGLRFQGDVLLFDQHTFVNVLDGRAAIGVGKDAAGHAIHPRLSGGPSDCRLDDPDSVITAYLDDETFRDLKHFDVAAAATRRLLVLGQLVKARGLGI